MIGAGRDSWFHRLTLVACGCLLGPWIAAHDAPPSGEPLPPVVRGYVPAEFPELWPRGAEPLIPLPPAEFDSLWRRAAGGQRADDVPAVTAQRVDISAELVGDELLRGTFVLYFKRATDDVELLPLAPCGVAIHDAHWAPAPLAGAGEEAATGDRPSGNRAALLANALGVPLVEVSGSGALTVRWSLRGKRDALGHFAWPLDFPWAAAQTLSCDLPLGKRAAVDGAVAIDMSNGQAAADNGRWQFALPPGGGSVLRVLEAGGDDVVAAAPRVRARVTHDVRLDRTDVEARLQIEAAAARPGALLILASPELEISECRAGGAELAWREAGPEAGAVDAWRQWEISLDRVAGLEQEPVVIRGRAPTVLDRTWSLPTISPGDGPWAEATHIVRVERPLLAEHLVVRDGRLSRYALLPPTAPGEVYEAQCYGPRAGIEAVFSTRRTPYRVRWSCRTVAAERTLRATVTAHVEAAAGSLANWQTEIRPPWVVKRAALATDDRDVPWSIQNQVGLAAQLVMRAPSGDATAAAHDFRIELERELPASQTELSARDVWPLSAARDQVEVMWLEIGLPAPMAWSTTGAASILAVDREALNAGDLALGLSGASDWLFDARLPLPEPLLTKTTTLATFEATVRSQLTLDVDHCEERHRVSLAPQGAPLDRIQIDLPDEGTTPWQWTCEEPRRCSVSATPLHTGAAAGVQRWEVLLSPPLTDVGEIVVRRTLPTQADFKFLLPRLATGATAFGQCLVVGDGALEAELAPLGLQRALPDAQSPGRVFAAYRYDPTANSPASLHVVVRSTHDTGSVAAKENSLSVAAAPLVWDQRVESTIGPGRDSRHRAQFRITAEPGSSLSIKMPPSAQLLSAHLDGQPTDWRESATDHARLEFQLPERYECRLTLEYILPGPAWRLWRRLENPAPLPAASVLARRWTVWLAPGFRMMNELAPAHDDWLARLTGPLRRSAALRAWQPPLRPTAAWSDWLHPSWTAAQRQAEAAEAAFGAAAGGRDETPRTWAELFRQAEQNFAAAQLELALDQAALEDLGLAPSHAGGAAVGATDLERGKNLLGRARLALLMAGRRVIVTTAAEVSQVWPGADWVTQTSALVDATSQVGADDAGPPLLSRPNSATAWSSQRPSPWQENGLAQGSAELPGWTVWRLDGESRSGALAAHESFFTGLLAAVALLTAGGCWRLGRTRLARAVWLGVACGMLALALPWPWGTPFSAALWGCAAVGVASWRFRSTAPSSGVRRRPGAATAVVCLAVVFGTRLEPARGQAAADGTNRRRESTTPVPTPAQILIPVDENQRPNGQPYHVPASLYQLLQQRAQAADSRSQTAIENVRYHAELRRNPSTGKTELARLTAHLDGLAAGPPLVLPLRWIDRPALDRVDVDGLEREVAWDNDAGGLRIADLPAGHFHLEAALHTPEDSLATARCELITPPIATATLEVDLPDAAITVDIPTARGEITRSADGRKLRAQLGGGERLVWQWRSTGLQALPRVEQLWWLQVQPGSVVWRLKLRCDAADAAFDRLALHYDSRLQWLANQATGSDGAQATADDSQPQTLHVRWAAPQLATREVELAWLVRGAVGIGQLPLPALDIPQAETTRVWLAASVDAALDFTSVVAEELAPAQFHERWRATEVDAQPTLARQLDPRRPRWEINTQPKPPALLVAERLEWLLAAGSSADSATDSQRPSALACLAYTAETQPDRGVRFSYELDLPAGIQLGRVSVLENEVEQARRWRLNEDGRLTVWLGAPATQSQTVHLEGQLPLPLPGTIALPRVALRDAEIQSHQTRVYRRPGVEVALASPLENVRLDDVPAPQLATVALPVAAWSVPPPTPVSFSITAAGELPAVKQTTVVSYDGEDWRLETTFEWSSTPGSAAPLCVEAPAELRGEIEFVPPLPHRWIPGSERAQTAYLAILPAALPDGPIRCALRCRIAAGSSGFSLPRLTPLTAGAASHVVLLPIQIGLLPAPWKTGGLERIELPTPQAPLAWSSETHEAYRAAGRIYSAELTSPLAAGDGPYVEWAAWEFSPTGGGTGKLAGLATFDIVPNGAVDLPLCLPAHVRVERIVVEGAAIVQSLPIDDRVCRVPLLADPLPQRVEIVFSCQPPGTRFGDVAAAAPTVIDWPVRQTLVRAWQPAGSPAAWSANAAASPTLSADVAHMRLARDAALLKTAAATATPAELRTWFLRRQASVAEHLSATAVGNRSPLVASFHRQLADEELLDLVQRTSRTRLASAMPAELWAASIDRRGIERVWRSSGDSPRDLGPYLAAAPPQRPAIPWRRLGTATMLGLAAWTMHRSRFLASLVFHPFLLWPVVGLIAWSWLQPVWLGPALLSLGLVAWLRSVWPVRRASSWLLPRTTAR